ncbi:MAG TPA: PaaI family thioesterase [Planctomycetota bacterium]|nr:PaaI family thioesterase [Planctomycetota bacterium]
MSTEPQPALGRSFGHARCIMCGSENSSSLGLVFRPSADGGVAAEFKGHAGLQGYEGLLHGGIASALLDAAMTNCLFRHGVKAVTARLAVRFRAPIPFGATLIVQARPIVLRPPLYKLAAELVDNGRVSAEAEAQFMSFPDVQETKPREEP